MKKLLLMLMVLAFAASAQAGAIQYIGNGSGEPAIKVSYSRNNGVKWETKILKPGQTFHVPKDATHLKIDNAPYDPEQNYRVKDGNVF